MQTRTDARGSAYAASYQYDAQNRLTQTSYGDTAITPSVVYCYDWKVYQSGTCAGAADP